MNTQRDERMPPLWAAGRRRMLLGLVALGLAMGAVSVLLAWQTGILVGAFSTGGVLVVIGLAGLFGLGKFVERVMAEKLGQHYVAQLRIGLLRHSLGSGRTPSLGITVARSTNDLSSVRNWVIQGLVPLTAGVPLVLFTVAGLWFTAPVLVIALLIPLGLELLLLGLLAPGAFRTARTLRRHRGSLAARIADTVTAASSINAAGGREREIGRLDQSAQKVISAAVDRSRFAGALRATALSVPLLGSVLVVALAAKAGLPTGAVASGLLLIGVSAAVLGEFGRMVEYRQNYKAARRILSPLLTAQQHTVVPDSRQRLPHGAVGNAPKQVRIQLGTGTRRQWPALLAGPGERICLQGPDGETEKILQDLAMGLPGQQDENAGLWISGRNAGLIEDRQRRRLLGAVLSSMALERGTVARALRYRRPSMKPEAAMELAAECGLEVEELPEGERTMLRRGGEPLTAQQRTALLLARAMLDEPQLLILDDIVGQLDERAAAGVADRLNRYPGVLLYRGKLPGVQPTRSWAPSPSAATAPLPTQATAELDTLATPGN